MEPIGEERFLTDQESAQVGTLFAQIVPRNADSGVPGAADAGAVDYLSYMLALGASEYHRIPEWQSTYREGLPVLDEACRSRFGTPLAELDDEHATATLELLSTRSFDELPDTFDQRSFFQMLRDHCIEGCFCDPRWAGNRNEIMWRWLGWVVPAQDIDLAEQP